MAVHVQGSNGVGFMIVVLQLTGEPKSKIFAKFSSVTLIAEAQFA